MDTPKNRLTVPQKLALIFLNTIFLGTLVYTFFHREFADILKYSAFISIPFLLFGIVINILNIEEGDQQIFWRTFVPGVVVLALACLVAAMFLYSLGASFKDGYSSFYYKWLLNPSIHRNWKSVSVATLVVTFAITFFIFRKKMRIIYGITECLIGILVAIDQIPKGAKNSMEATAQKLSENANTGNNNTFYLLLLTASIYLIVTGFDNVKEGVEQKSDPLALELWQRIKNLFKKDKDDNNGTGEETSS